MRYVKLVSHPCAVSFAYRFRCYLPSILSIAEAGSNLTDEVSVPGRRLIGYMVHGKRLANPRLLISMCLLHRFRINLTFR